jgi:putative holliday junction resolvase
MIIVLPLSLMARIIGIDYGGKRCGIATTDPFQIIVTALDTVDTPRLIDYLDRYLLTETIEKIVVGLPVHKDGNFTYLKADIDTFITKGKEKWPQIAFDFADEQFSSVQAKQVILASGAKKKTRQDKALVDRVSAVIILQKYLKHI